MWPTTANGLSALFAPGLGTRRVGRAFVAPLKETCRRACGEPVPCDVEMALARDLPDRHALRICTVRRFGPAVATEIGSDA